MSDNAVALSLADALQEGHAIDRHVIAKVLHDLAAENAAMRDRVTDLERRLADAISDAEIARGEADAAGKRVAELEVVAASWKREAEMNEEFAELATKLDAALADVASPEFMTKYRALQADAARLNWLDSMKYMGYGLISDDNGHYAVSVTGIQNVPMTDEPCDIQTTFFVEAAEWKDSAREAIDDAMKEGET